jgi:hypothetical protein
MGKSPPGKFATRRTVQESGGKGKAGFGLQDWAAVADVSAVHYGASESRFLSACGGSE